MEKLWKYNLVWHGTALTLQEGCRRSHFSITSSPADSHGGAAFLLVSGDLSAEVQQSCIYILEKQTNKAVNKPSLNVVLLRFASTQNLHRHGNKRRDICIPLYLPTLQSSVRLPSPIDISTLYTYSSFVKLAF